MTNSQIICLIFSYLVVIIGAFLCGVNMDSEDNDIEPIFFVGAIMFIVLLVGAFGC